MQGIVPHLLKLGALPLTSHLGLRKALDHTANALHHRLGPRGLQVELLSTAGQTQQRCQGL